MTRVTEEGRRHRKTLSLRIAEQRINNIESKAFSPNSKNPKPQPHRNTQIASAANATNRRTSSTTKKATSLKNSYKNVESKSSKKSKTNTKPWP